MDAGAAALRFNSPLGDDRAAAIVEAVGASAQRHVVDLGCGRGALLLDVLRHHEHLTGTGVDTDEAALDAARRQAQAAGVADRATFVPGDLATWTGDADAALSVGSSHAAGGIAALAARLAELPVHHGVIGDGVWAQDPDEWCRETFGAMPSVDEAIADVEVAGWTVERAELASLVEWDAFEGGWIAGVRAVGTPAAAAFADEREAEYRRYRGTLGFLWLTVRR